jgi:hypothetical protein
MKSFILKPLYDRAVDGIPGLGTPEEAVARFGGEGTPHERAERLTTVYLGLCASTGFVMGLGGWLTLPVTLPANVAGVALLHLHMCAAYARLGGLDPHDADVKERAVCVLLGSPTPEPTREESEEVLDRSAVKLAERGLVLVAETALGLAKHAGEYAVKKIVKRRLIRRSIPFLGGILGGISDYYATRQVSQTAADAFLDGGDGGEAPPRLPTSDGHTEDATLSTPDAQA